MDKRRDLAKRKGALDPPLSQEARQQSCVAVFDLDGTITNCDTYLYFLIFSLLKQPARWIKTPMLAVAVVMHFAGLRDNSWLKAYFLRTICKGWSEKMAAHRSKAFISFILRRHIRADALARIKSHREAGCRQVLASASPDIYVDDLAARLGFDEVICTRVQWSGEGVVTGDLDGGNCYGQNKLKRVDDFLQGQGPFVQIFAYSDHHSDVPLLQRATDPVAVSPTSKLQQIAKTDGYGIENWS